MKAQCLQFITFLFLGFMSWNSSCRATQVEVFPDKEWQKSEGLKNKNALKNVESISKKIGTCALIVVHKGKIILEEGFISQPFDLHNVSHCLLNAIYGLHEDEISLDLTLEKLNLDDTPHSLSPMEKSATIEDLLRMRSGVYHEAAGDRREDVIKRPLRGSYPPGLHCLCNCWNTNALNTIFQRITKKKILEEFDEKIAKTLQMQDYSKFHTHLHRTSSSQHAQCVFRLSARDLARFGLLYSRGGTWNRKILLSPNWIEKSIAAQFPVDTEFGYGYLWWIANGEIFGSSIPDKALVAIGGLGEYLIVIPAIDLVIVHFSAKKRLSNREFGELLGVILAEIS